ncbi:hypothetical protein DFAR_1470048 [Desulfarculales bacterium]
MNQALRDIKAISDKIRQHYRLKKRIGKCWLSESDDVLIKRQYNSYEDYAEHQQAKFKLKNICPRKIEGYDQRLLLKRLTSKYHFGVVQQTRTALCLGTR